MGFIVIDYDSLILVTVLAFAAIGLSRGWLTEFINTILLVLLSVLLIKPEMLEPILSKLNQLFKMLMALLKSGFSFEIEELAKNLKGMDNVIDPGNPYPVLLALTIALLAMQYAGTRIKLTGELSVLSRILGAILGAVNANIVISLGKEMIRKHTEIEIMRVRASAQDITAFQTQAAGVQALAPQGVVLALKDAPPGFLPESSWIWIVAVILAVGAVLLINHFTDKEIGTP
ncbi:MAG: hypothetical protein B6I34_11325 [Anaerolineaceae bacterium 4572_32.1]|nr:MAG: hypothetical protein B6I34_11325 [Anaerolineaceae bacterium 4572_32.1]